MNRPLIALGLALVLGVVGSQIVAKEATLADGRLVLLELAPVDPRSLMQGDYMILRYAISNDIQRGDWPADGRLLLVVDADGVGHLEGPAGLGKLAAGLPPDKVALRYRIRDGAVRIGAESYFFEEGTADVYAEARFGGLRVAPDGNSVLVGLFDESRRPLGVAAP